MYAEGAASCFVTCDPDSYSLTLSDMPACVFMLQSCLPDSYRDVAKGRIHMLKPVSQLGHWTSLRYSFNKRQIIPN